MQHVHFTPQCVEALVKLVHWGSTYRLENSYGKNNYDAHIKRNEENPTEQSNKIEVNDIQIKLKIAF